MAWCSSSPSGVVHRWPGWMIACGAVAGSSAKVYGSGPRRMATSPGLHRVGGPPSGTYQASPRTTATRHSGARSSMRTDHGGSITVRRANAPWARGPASIPPGASMAAIVDARTCIRAPGPWTVSPAPAFTGPMIDGYPRTLTVIAALGAALSAGVFFAFSTFVMQALRRLPDEQGLAAMQAINKAAPTPLFMLALF